MELNQIVALRELAARGSVTAVARATHRSASAVSQQLASLQRDVGVVLVRRTGRGVELTEAGRALAQEAEGVTAAVAQLEAFWEEYTNGQGGDVTIASFPSASELLVPGVLMAMRQHPQVGLSLGEEDATERGFARLVHDYDIVIAHRSDGAESLDRRGLKVLPLLREPLDVAMPAGDPLENRAVLAPEDIADRDWVGVPEGYPLDRVLRRIAVQTGVEPRIVFRSLHLPLLESMVAAGHGLALLPRYTSRRRAGGRLVFSPLGGVHAARHIEALVRPEQAVRPVVRNVLEILRLEAAGIVDH